MDGHGVRAEVNLTFRSRSLRESGVFVPASPHWQTMWDDEEVRKIRERDEEEIKRMRSQDAGGTPAQH